MSTLASDAPSLAGLLIDNDLGLELVAGSDQALQWPISSVVTADSVGTTAVPGSLLLTTESDLPDPAGWLNDLRLAGVVAVGVAGGALDDQMSALTEPAARLDFPIFAIPPGTSFGDIIDTVFRLRNAAEPRQARRIAFARRFLIDALGEEDPQAVLLDRVAELTDAAVGIVDARGEIVASTQELPVEEIAAELQGAPATAGVSLSSQSSVGFALPIGGADEPSQRWLVIVAATSRRPPHSLSRAVAHIAIPLLRAVSRLERAKTKDALVVSRVTLDGLLDRPEQGDASVLAARAATFGLSIESGVVVVAASDPTGQMHAEELLDAALERFVTSGVKALATVRDGRWTGLFQAPLGDALIAEHLLSTSPTLRVGVGRGVTDPRAVTQSWSDAALALREGGRRMRNRIIRYDDLDLGTVLLNEVPFDRLKPKIDEWLIPLRENPIIYETLMIYLKRDLDVARTARSLHLHPNSVRYRLNRAEELIGVRLRASSTIAALYVLLLADNAWRDGTG